MEHIINFSVPLPYVLGTIVAIPVLLLIKYLIIMFIKSENEIQKRNNQYNQVQDTFRLSTGHKIQFRYSQPYNHAVLEVFYGQHDTNFEDFKYWGKLVDESLPETEDWEVWMPYVPKSLCMDGTIEHCRPKDGMSKDGAKEYAIRDIKSLLGIKNKPQESSLNSSVTF